MVQGVDLNKKGLAETGNSMIGRPEGTYLLKKVFKGQGLIFNQGPSWKNLRKFSSVALHDFGVGKKVLEERIMDEVQIATELMAQSRGQPINLRAVLQDCVANIIFSIIKGERFAHDDPQFRELLTMLDVLVASNSLMQPENFLPCLRFLPISSPIKRGLETNEKLREHFRGFIREHEKTFDGDNIRDFLDLYLKVQSEGGSEKEGITEDHMFRLQLDLFVAGTHTTSTNLTWFFLYMLHHTDVQRKCHKEIMSVVGTDRAVTLRDRASLPYCNAAIHEVIRLASVVPTTMPHRVTEEVELGGFTLPVDSIVIFNLHSANMDPTYWDRPKEFRPQRWLDTDHGTFTMYDDFMPFGMGPRVCIGKPLAQMELFLFVTNFLQRFTFSKDVGEPMPSLKPNQDGAMLHPPVYKLCATKN